MGLLETLVEKPRTPDPIPPAPLREDGDWVDVIPYNAYIDPNCRLFMSWLYNKLQEEGLISLYYPEAAGDDKLFPTFVRMLSSDVTKVILVVLKADNGDVKDVIGFATWEAVQFGPAHVGHCGFIFRKNYWHRHTSVEAGHRIMKWWFDEASPRLDVTLGLIAQDNILAQRYIRALGWTQLGVLPGCHQYDGRTSDAVVWRYTRTEFEARS